MREHLDVRAVWHGRRAGKDIGEDRDIPHAAGDVVAERADEAVDHIGETAIDHRDGLPE